jgi:hypothetical protein
MTPRAVLHSRSRTFVRPARASRILGRIQEAAGAWQDRWVLLARLDRSCARLRRRLRAGARGLERRFLASVRPLAAERPDEPLPPARTPLPRFPCPSNPDIFFLCAA